jgi:hypothetical protein
MEGRRALRIVLRACVESFTRPVSARASEKRRDTCSGCWEATTNLYYFSRTERCSHIALSFCGTGQANCDCLNDWLTEAARDGKEGSTVVRQPDCLWFAVVLAFQSPVRPGRSDGSGRRRAQRCKSVLRNSHQQSQEQRRTLRAPSSFVEP